MLQNVEIVKGPGADSPEVNYAIGGTVNFITKNPTYQSTGMWQVGVDNWGSSIINVGLSDTVGRLGYVFAYGSNDLESSVSNTSVFVSPQSPQQGVLNFNGPSAIGIGFNDQFPTPPVSGTVSTNTTGYNLVACCQRVPANLFQNVSQLAKLRYKLSPASFLTFTYLGSQMRTDQAANTGDITHATFSLTGSGATPGQIASYNGAIPNNSPLDVGFVRTPEYEINNEPILEGDFRTTIGNDTLLARYYSAGIHRLLFQGNSQTPFAPTVENMQLYGYDTATNQVYNGQTVPVAFYDYFNQAENDVLKGYSLEYDHPFANDDVLTFSVDTTHSTTTSYNVGVSGPSAGKPFNGKLALTQSVALPTGSLQNFSTALLRGLFHIGPKLTATWSNYFNIYQSTVPTVCKALSITYGIGHCNFDGSGTTGSANGITPGQPAPGYSFSTTTTTHYDPRIALEYRLQPQTAIRLSIGSAISPPFLAEPTTVPGPISFSSQTRIATEQLQSGGLKPETAFGLPWCGSSFQRRGNLRHGRYLSNESLQSFPDAADEQRKHVSGNRSEHRRQHAVRLRRSAAVLQAKHQRRKCALRRHRARSAARAGSRLRLCRSGSAAKRLRVQSARVLLRNRERGRTADLYVHDESRRDFGSELHGRRHQRLDVLQPGDWCVHRALVGRHVRDGQPRAEFGRRRFQQSERRRGRHRDAIRRAFCHPEVSKSGCGIEASSKIIFHSCGITG